MTGLYEGEEYVAMYEDIRPVYPDEVVTEVLKFLDEQNPGKKRRGFMLDVGCGGGQATRLFAHHFIKVLGIDQSMSQIDIAKKIVANAEFQVGSASVLPVESGSVDLVIAGTATHYFDFDAFLSECDRVLSTGGCVALFTYFPYALKTLQGNVIEEPADALTLMSHLTKYAEEIGVSADDLKIFGQQYQPIYDRINKPSKRMVRGVEFKKKYTLDEYIIYLETIGEYRANKNQFADKDPLVTARNRLETLIGFTDAANNEPISVTFKCPIVLFTK